MMKRKIILCLFFAAAIIATVPGCSRLNSQTTEQSENTKEAEKLKKECIDKINETYDDLDTSGYHFVSYIGDTTIYDFGKSGDGNILYLDARYADLPIMYYDIENQKIYYRQSDTESWQVSDADSVLYLKNYILQRQKEFLTNYLNYADEDSMSINENAEINGEPCYDISFSYNGSRLFSDLNNDLSINTENNNDTDSNAYTAHYYVKPNDKSIIALETNIGERYGFNIGDSVALSDECKLAIPGSITKQNSTEF